MQITFLSILNTAVWSSVLLAALHRLRGKSWFRDGAGSPLLPMLYALLMARAFLPLDFSRALVIPVRRIFPDIYYFLWSPRGYAGAHPISVLTALLGIWLTVFGLLLAQYGCIYARTIRSIRKYARPAEERAQAMLAGIMRENGRQIRLALLEMPRNVSPYGIGAFRKRIVLPERPYTDRELRCVLTHEYMHFVHHDFWLKQAAMLCSMLFWWIPAIRLLKADMEEALEIQCDLAAVRRMDWAERYFYLQTELQELKHVEAPLPYASTHLSANREAETIRKRFRAVMGLDAQPPRSVRALVLGIFALLIFVSYATIVQPDSPPPLSTEPDTIDFEIADSYILHTKDGEYWIYVENTRTCEISAEAAGLYEENGYIIVQE